MRKISPYLALALLALAVTPWIGPEPVRMGRVADYLRTGITSTDAEIFFYQRLPRVMLGFAAGGALAMVGAAFQVVLRNPLVEPYTLGATGGAALGAVLAISVPQLWVVIGPMSSVQVLALIGAGATLMLIYGMARSPAGFSVTTMLLAGITISIICGGGIMLTSYLANPHMLTQFHRWMMGGIDVVGFKELATLCPLLFPGIGLLLFHANDLNHLALGEQMAAGHGVDVPRVQKWIFVGGGLATAGVVSLVGPIGFVGLIVPHAVRRMSGFDQRIVLPACFLLGGAVLAVCDAAARTVLAPMELPVGIITAIMGGPLFIRLLLSAAPRK